ncbi:MAG: complex I subunit 1 family protein [PVC group bacterium]
MNALTWLFYFLIFPGFLFTAVVGCLAGWVDRKVTARVQWRVGPPWYQSFADFLKLMGKETIVPSGSSKIVFLLSPLFGMGAVVIVSMILWLSDLTPSGLFVGDLIVVLYLLAIPAVAVIIGGFASRNPLSALGASREMKLMLAYELPFVLAVLVPVARSGLIKIGGLLLYQAQNGMFLGSLSGILAFIVALLCQQAKLTLVPFDIPEAETEIVSGPYLEYSGPPLAVYRLTRLMMLFVMPMFLVVVFMGGIDFSGWHIVTGILKYVLILVLVVLIRNTNPRVRIDQAVKFFWGPVFAISVIAMVLALIGL